MTEPSDFDDRVARLGQADEFAGEARVIARTQDGGVALAVLNAVDETILPAELIFASEAGETLTLSAAARRVRSVTAASDDLSPDDLLGKELDPEDEAGLRAAIDLLDRFARGASGTVVVSEQRAEENATRGVSAKRLIGMLPAEDETPDAAPAGGGGKGADGFLATGGRRILASVVRSASGDVVHAGEDALIGVLSGLGDCESRDNTQVFDLWLKQTGAPEGHAFGRAIWIDGTIATLAFVPADVADLVSAFRASCAE